MPHIEFSVEGVPVAKARARIGNNGAYTPTKTKLYERKIAYKAREAMVGRLPVDCAVKFELMIYMPIPESFSKKKREALDGKPHTSKPDASNILKSAEDAINGIVYKDDNQIYNVSVWKFYSNYPHIEVKVSWE